MHLFTRHQADFNWTEEQENVFREVKRLVSTAAVLSYNGDSILKQQRHSKYLGVVVDESVIIMEQSCVIYCLESLS